MPAEIAAELTPTRKRDPSACSFAERGSLGTPTTRQARPQRAAASGEQPEIVAKGLGPSRPQHLEYSAPTAEGGVAHSAGPDDDEAPDLGPDASRAERRRAARAARKKRR